MGCLIDALQPLPRRLDATSKTSLARMLRDTVLRIRNRQKLSNTSTNGSDRLDALSEHRRRWSYAAADRTPTASMAMRSTTHVIGFRSSGLSNSIER